MIAAGIIVQKFHIFLPRPNVLCVMIFLQMYKTVFISLSLEIIFYVW